MPHLRRDGAVVPRRDEGQPPQKLGQNGCDGDDVNDGTRLVLVQLQRYALAFLPPPGGGVPAADQNLRFTPSLAFVRKYDIKFIKCSCAVCTVFTYN